MINKTVQDAINEQIKNELYSAYLYLSMSAYFEAENLPGFAHWMRVQAGEEQEHAMKFYAYVCERSGRVQLKAIDQPPFEWSSTMEVFQQVLQHEQKVTSLIHNLFTLALKENDYPTQVMLHWFINEQVEEEKNASAILEQVKMIEARGSAILYLDHELGERGEE
ncbi:MAG: ferritin [Chloroflexi bacterium RBG_16_52_11]|nr:MAG: ferritin [Chloroflexi bacterium RBG_16_52_11]